jgi:hypothetical protein
MAVWQIESGACTGRGFAAVDANGILSKFYDYITKIPAAGGPGWTILRDMSATPATKNFDPADVNTGTEEITEVAHGYVTGDTILFSNTGGGLPTGLSAATTYYVIKVSANVFKVASSLAYAYAGTAVNITGQGTGTHHVVLDGPYVVVSDNASPAINEVCFVIKLGYKTLDAGYMWVQQFLGWDDTNKIAVGLWDGHRIQTVDAGPFAYDFRGGAQGMIFQTRIGTDWDTAGVDTFTASVNFLEAASVVTDLTAQAAAGLAVSIEVSDSSAFTAGKDYFIYDLSGVPLVNYVHCTGISDGTHIEVTQLYDTFPIGAVIGAYPHRFYTFGTNANSFGAAGLNYLTSYSKIPYCSAANGYQFHDQDGVINGAIQLSQMTNALTTHAPGDDSYFAVQKGFICEYYRENQQNVDTGMNRAYGITNNAYVTYNNSLAEAQDGRTIGGANYLYFQRHDRAFNNGSSNLAVLLLDTEALV